MAHHRIAHSIEHRASHLAETLKYNWNDRNKLVILILYCPLFCLLLWSCFHQTINGPKCNRFAELRVDIKFKFTQPVARTMRSHASQSNQYLLYASRSLCLSVPLYSILFDSIHFSSVQFALVWFYLFIPFIYLIVYAVRFQSSALLFLLFSNVVFFFFFHWFAFQPNASSHQCQILWHIQWLLFGSKGISYSSSGWLFRWIESKLQLMWNCEQKKERVSNYIILFDLN